MSELNIFYKRDGEWLNAVTADYSGPIVKIEPKEHDVQPAMFVEPQVHDGTSVIDLDQGANWAPLSSARGHFAIHAPYNRPLEDWSLELWGLPRLYPQLNMQAVAELFGPELPTYIEMIHTETLPHRESIGDLRVTEAAMGPRNTTDIQDAMRKMGHIAAQVEDINHKTQSKRSELLAQATRDSGHLIISRTVLIHE